MKFAVKSKRVLISKELKGAVLVIEDEIIKDILSYECSLDYEVIDFGNLVIMPGLVDTHVHINEPGRTEWEGFETATKAAAAGGITMLVDMPLNSSPVTTTAGALKEKIRSAENKLYVNCGFYGGLTPDNINELETLINSGIFGLKAFMIDSGIDEFPPVNESHLKKATALLTQTVRSRHIPLLVHAEIDCGYDKTSDYDKCSFESFLQTRPGEWENKAIELLIRICREYKYPVHIVHLSSSEAIKILSSAKDEGLPLTVETCPHYLFFFSEEIRYGDTRFKCTPPIRKNVNKEMLWQAIKDGTIDFIVSDHSPCSQELKNFEEGNFESAWGGISSLQHSLSVVWTEAKKRKFTIPDISKLMSENTARFIGLDNRKGSIKIGYDADLVVFDPDKKFFVEKKDLLYRHKISPYVGRELEGTVEATFVGGKEVFSKGEIIDGPAGKIILKQAFSKN